jgi:DNA-binding NarL/FixJ family response regulator
VAFPSHGTRGAEVAGKHRGPFRETTVALGRGGSYPGSVGAQSTAPRPPLPGERRVRVLIVEDHALVREGTAALLEDEPDLEIVGQAGTGEDGLAAAVRLRPDVVLVDVELPGMSGIALTRELASRVPTARALVLSAHDDYAYVTESLEAGAAGYLLKTASRRQLADAVRTVADGALVLDEPISRRLARRWRDTGPPVALTAREADVLRLVARGLANKQIARELGLGVRTVESHVSSLLGKLGATSRTEAAVFALSHGLVEADTGHDGPSGGP